MKADAIVFALSGDMDHEHMERLQEMLGIEKHGRLLLDLKDVTLVGRAKVQFLARVGATEDSDRELPQLRSHMDRRRSLWG